MEGFKWKNLSKRAPTALYRVDGIRYRAAALIVITRRKGAKT
jgi:hypothetical protein